MIRTDFNLNISGLGINMPDGFKNNVGLSNVKSIVLDDNGLTIVINYSRDNNPEDNVIRHWPIAELSSTKLEIFNIDKFEDVVEKVDNISWRTNRIR